MSSNVTFEDIIEILTETSYSPYGVWKVLNEIMKANGRDEIRSQMMYNYARNGLIVPKQKLFGEALRPITQVEVANFLVRYMNKHDLQIKVKANEDQLALFEIAE